MCGLPYAIVLTTCSENFITTKFFITNNLTHTIYELFMNYLAM